MYLSDIKEAIQVFGQSLYQLYGQGETPMTISNLTKKMHHSFYGMDHDYILSSVGVARTGVEISIVSQDGEEVPTDSIGEIITRSPCVMSGYLNNESATKNTLKNGWLYTGDMGSIDKYGVLTLKDRSKDPKNMCFWNHYRKTITERYSRKRYVTNFQKESFFEKPVCSRHRFNCFWPT